MVAPVQFYVPLTAIGMLGPHGAAPTRPGGCICLLGRSGARSVAAANCDRTPKPFGLTNGLRIAQHLTNASGLRDQGHRPPRWPRRRLSRVGHYTPSPPGRRCDCSDPLEFR